MKQTFPIRPLVYAFVFLGVFSGCSKIGVQEGISPSLTSDAYTSAFYSNLISAGMSASDAAFVSGYTGNSATAFVNNLLSVAAASSDTIEKAKESSSLALEKIADNSRFPSSSNKHDAVELISQAQFATLAELIDESDLRSAIDEVAGTLAAEIDSTGLDSSDLITASLRQGKGIAKGLIGSSVSAELQDDLMSAFSKGAVEGILNNPTLSLSGVDLISALTQGLLGEVGNENGGALTGEGKGLIIREILKGIQEQINSDPNLSDDDKSGYVSEIWDSNSDAVNEFDSTIKDSINDGLYSTDSELHIISVYQAATSSQWVDNGSGGMVSQHFDSSATVNIAAGTKPVVLVLASYEGVDWHLTGAVNRVSKVILHGYYDQQVDSVDASKVQHFSYESGNCEMYKYTFTWPTTVDDYGAKAFAVKSRSDAGFQITSFQSTYEENSFTVGDSLNAPPPLPALSFVRPWIFVEDNLVEGYDAAGAPLIPFHIKVAGVLSSSVQVRVWVENVTTSTADIPAFDETYTIAAGSNGIAVYIPFNQVGDETVDETFKVHIEAPTAVLNATPIVDGLIHHGIGLGGGGDSGGGDTGGGTGGGDSGSGGPSSTTVRSKYASVSISDGLATIQFGHSLLEPRMCSTVAYTYSVQLDTANSLNAAFLAAYPSASNQWLSVTLDCPSAPATVTDGDMEWHTQSAKTFPSGCTVGSFEASTAYPTGIQCL